MTSPSFLTARDRMVNEIIDLKRRGALNTSFSAQLAHEAELSAALYRLQVDTQPRILENEIYTSMIAYMRQVYKDLDTPGNVETIMFNLARATREELNVIGGMQNSFGRDRALKFLMTDYA